MLKLVTERKMLAMLLVRRDTREKVTVSFENILSKIKELMEEIQHDLYEKAKILTLVAFLLHPR